MKKVFKLSIFTVAFALLFTGSSWGSTITVGPEGPPTYDYATIQEAIDAASSGDTIFIYNGTYSATTSPFVRITTDSLTLMGESRDGVILDGTGSSTIYWAKGIHVTANNVTIKNITVQNFGAPGYWGYGVLFRNYAHYNGFVDSDQNESQF